MIKIFLSHAMHGKTDAEVQEIREKAIDKIREANPRLEFSIINNYQYDDAPPNAGRLWYLGRSIQCMANADAVYFCEGWENANGCNIEMAVAERYGLKIMSPDNCELVLPTTYGTLVKVFDQLALIVKYDAFSPEDSKFIPNSYAQYKIWENEDKSSDIIYNALHNLPYAYDATLLCKNGLLSDPTIDEDFEIHKSDIIRESISLKEFINMDDSNIKYRVQCTYGFPTLWTRKKINPENLPAGLAVCLDVGHGSGTDDSYGCFRDIGAECYKYPYSVISRGVSLDNIFHGSVFKPWLDSSDEYDGLEMTLEEFANAEFPNEPRVIDTALDQAEKFEKVIITGIETLLIRDPLLRVDLPDTIYPYRAFETCNGTIGLRRGSIKDHEDLGTIFSKVPLCCDNYSPDDIVYTGEMVALGDFLNARDDHVKYQIIPINGSESTRVLFADGDNPIVTNESTYYVYYMTGSGYIVYEEYINSMFYGHVGPLAQKIISRKPLELRFSGSLHGSADDKCECYYSIKGEYGCPKMAMTIEDFIKEEITNEQHD